MAAQHRHLFFWDNFDGGDDGQGGAPAGGDDAGGEEPVETLQDEEEEEEYRLFDYDSIFGPKPSNQPTKRPIAIADTPQIDADTPQIADIKPSHPNNSGDHQTPTWGGDSWGDSSDDDWNWEEGKENYLLLFLAGVCFAPSDTVSHFY